MVSEYILGKDDLDELRIVYLKREDDKWVLRDGQG
jgi:hypothetical protein